MKTFLWIPGTLIAIAIFVAVIYWTIIQFVHDWTVFLGTHP